MHSTHITLPCPHNNPRAKLACRNACSRSRAYLLTLLVRTQQALASAHMRALAPTLERALAHPRASTFRDTCASPCSSSRAPARAPISVPAVLLRPTGAKCHTSAHFFACSLAPDPRAHRRVPR
eukprot:6214440-Pleurochrysis_carterae.AAC.2